MHYIFQIPVKPLFTGFMELVNKILSRDTVSHESHLVIEDVLTIIVKRSKGLYVLHVHTIIYRERNIEQTHSKKTFKTRSD